MESSEGKINISQKAILCRQDGKLLTIRRSATDPRRPLHWDLPGGAIEVGEDAKESIRREIREETNLEVENIRVMDVIAAFNDIGEFWVTICYTAKPISSKVTLSYEHDDAKWVTPQEFAQLEASPRNKQFVEIFTNYARKT